MKSFYFSVGQHILETDSFGFCETVCIRKFLVHPNERTVSENGKLTWNIKVKVEILAVSVVKEKLTASRIPILLVRALPTTEKQLEYNCYLVHVDLQNSTFIPLKKCALLKKELNCMNSTSGNKELDQGALTSQQLRDMLHVTDGPGLVLCCKSSVSVFYSDRCTMLERFSFDFNHVGIHDYRCCCDKSKWKIERSYIVHAEKCSERFLIFLTFKVKAVCDQHQPANRTYTQVLQFHKNQFTVIDIRIFFPKEYSGCITSVYIDNLEYVNQQFKSQVFLGTLDGYVLQVRNGVLINCSEVYEQNAVSSIQMSTFAQNPKRLLVGAQDSYTVLSERLQVLEEYLGYRHVLVGDFLQSGSKQFLFLAEDLEPDTPWIITDFVTKVSSNEDASFRPYTDKTSSQTAAKALQGRLQREQVLLHEEEAHLQKMIDFISTMFARQVSLGAGQNLRESQHKPELVPVIAGSVSSGTSPAQQDCLTLLKCELWQRTLHGKWCVGVDVTCLVDRTVRLWIDLIPASDSTEVHVTSSHLTFHVSDNAISTESSIPKKPRLHSDTSEGHILNKDNIKPSDSGKFQGSVVCVLDLPMFAVTDCVVLKVVLNWMVVEESTNSSLRRPLTGHTSRGAVTGSGPKLCTICCGQVTLSAEDVLKEEHELDLSTKPSSDNELDVQDYIELRRSHLAWKRIQNDYTVVLKANPGILAGLENLLIGQCRFWYNQQYDCYVSSVGTLSGIQIELSPATRDDFRKFEVFVRNEKELFLMIHHLYSHLPDCAVILPPESVCPDKTIENKSAVQREAHFLSHDLRKLLENDSARSSADADDSGDNDSNDLGKAGEKFKIQKEKFMRTQIGQKKS